jgi:quinol monooxygenase YgiN
MNTLLYAMSIGVALILIGAVRDVQAQTPVPAPAPAPVIEGNVYTAIYVEVMPSSRADGVTALKRYREAARAEDGNLRCDVASRIGQPHQFVILEVWKDQKAFEAHGKSTSAAQLREKVHAIRSAPLDERVHIGVSVGPLQPGPAADAVYVVTHVDVIPPRKEDGLAAVKQLGDDSRKDPGNVRFEVAQQTNRPNHFTVVEIWKDAKAVDTHSMSETTRRFRDKLGPMSGALYDERLFKAVE